MRNENLELAQSSGSESSPSCGWGSSNAQKSSTSFNYDFEQGKTIDDLTTQFTSTLKPTKSTEVLGEVPEDKNMPSTSAAANSSRHLPLPSTSRKISKQGSGASGGRSNGASSSSTKAKDKKPSKESKIAKFLRRSQSATANDEQAASGSKQGESSKGPTLPKIDDVEEEPQKRKRNTGTDIKFKQFFLKRRHTEGTINTSVRPPPEEAQKWANSFEDLMGSKYGQALFRAFLQRDFCDENIEFWLAVENYRKYRPSKLAAKAHKIFVEFIIPQAPKEVNLDALTRESLLSKMANPTVTTFDQAQKRIQTLLESDAYTRFLNSQLYLELVHPERYQAPSAQP